ncbi:MAG: TatD family hydrolase [Nanoarchaeota archaeon]|nr:TatD family hydrolase [Nanoarchaeota archaeon]
MKLVDIHAHLEHARFEKDLDSVIERFKKAGGEFIIESGVNPATNRVALEIAEKYDVVKVSFGLYPIDALAKEVEAGESEGFLREIAPKGVHQGGARTSSRPPAQMASAEADRVGKFDVDEELAWIEENADKCVAIGEIGLDYNSYSRPARNSVPSELGTSPEVPDSSGKMREKQKEVFRKVLKLAKKIDKPVVIHSRKAEEDAIDILEELKMKAVIMHCFNGKKSLIKRGVDNGWFFSVPPVIARLEHFKMLVEMVPLEQLLTETDAPYLSPVAGERNESANVVVTIGEIAKIKGLGEDEVAEQIFNNVKNLFNL